MTDKPGEHKRSRLDEPLEPSDRPTKKLRIGEFHSVYVGHLPSACDEKMLTELASEAGTVVSVRIMRDNKTYAPLGYGFINYTSSDAARRAIDMLHGRQMLGRILRVGPAQDPRSPHWHSAMTVHDRYDDYNDYHDQPRVSSVVERRDSSRAPGVTPPESLLSLLSRFHPAQPQPQVPQPLPTRIDVIVEPHVFNAGHTVGPNDLMIGSYVKWIRHGMERTGRVLGSDDRRFVILIDNAYHAISSQPVVLMDVSDVVLLKQ